MTLSDGTAFVDITDPINPVFVGRLDSQSGESNIWRDVKVYQNHAFIVADFVSNHGMQVFDLTRLRNATPGTTFTRDALYSDVTSCHNIAINESKGIAYLTDCKNVGRGVHFVDISDPLNPTTIGNYNADGTTHDANVVTYAGPDTDHTGKEILIGSNETKVVILDVSNPSSVIKIAELSYPQLGYTHQGWFTEDQRYFILGDETDEQDFGFITRTLVFDFSDLDNPSLSSTYTGPTPATDHNGYVKGDLFYMASYQAGLRIMDITNISASSNSMTEVGYFDTHPEGNSVGTGSGAWGVYPFFPSGNIVISDIEKGLFVVRKSGTLSTISSTFDSQFSVSPNPADESPKVIARQNETINSVVVFNVLGKKVYSKENINETEFVLPLSNQSKGMYFVRINNSISKKLILR